MRRWLTDDELMWDDEELPPNCYFRALRQVAEDPRLQGSNLLPIELHRPEIENAIRHNSITAIRAETGSGKSLKLIEYMLSNLNMRGCPSQWPGVVVQHSCFAAEKLAESLVQYCRWPPGAIHVRMGKCAYTMDSDSMQESDACFNGGVNISIITYGILWR